jgi:2-polyprenyl-6-methoxyphenol hydroxylase-like FAD-dependent oxidoreductase
VTNGNTQGNASDVVVIGGGPTGLSMALHLAMYGVTSTLLETEPTTRRHPKGNTNNARTMELFRRLGIVDAVRALGVPADHPFDIAFFTRLNAFEIARGRTPSRAERMQMRQQASATDQVPEPPHRANQMYVEQLLFERAAASPYINLKFGCTVRSLSQDDEGVTVVTIDHTGPEQTGLEQTGREQTGREQTWRARYVVGCDGGRSMVRRTLGIKYAGEAQLMDVFLAGLFTAVHLRIPDLYPRFVGQRRAWMYMTVNRDEHTAMISLNGRDEFIMQIPSKPGQAMDERALVRKVQQAIGAGIPVEVISHRQWNAGAYLVAESYQAGRIFLAGDAAHLYTPTGGYGLNTGVDDTSNLSWKIAAVLQGWGGQTLLDSYGYERRQAALRSSDVARGLGKTRIRVDVPPEAEEDSPQGEAARSVIAQSPFVTTHHFTLPEERDWLGVILGSRYDGSPVVASDKGPPPDSLETYQPTDIPGGRAPHLWLDGGRGAGSSLYDHIAAGLTLLRFEPRNVQAIETAAKARGIPLTVVDVNLPAARTLYERALYLVRPDCIIAWRGDDLPDNAGVLLDTITGRSSMARPEAQAPRQPSGA